MLKPPACSRARVSSRSIVRRWCSRPWPERSAAVRARAGHAMWGKSHDRLASAYNPRAPWPRRSRPRWSKVYDRLRAPSRKHRRRSRGAGAAGALIIKAIASETGETVTLCVAHRSGLISWTSQPSWTPVNSWLDRECHSMPPQPAKHFLPGSKRGAGIHHSRPARAFSPLHRRRSRRPPGRARSDHPAGLCDVSGRVRNALQRRRSRRC